MIDNSFIKAGTAGGTLTVVLMNITTESIAETSVLAAIGAAVSFLVSYCLKQLFKKNKR